MHKLFLSTILALLATAANAQRSGFSLPDTGLMPGTNEIPVTPKLTLVH